MRFASSHRPRCGVVASAGRMESALELAAALPRAGWQATVVQVPDAAADVLHVHGLAEGIDDWPEGVPVVLDLRETDLARLERLWAAGDRAALECGREAAAAAATVLVPWPADVARAERLLATDAAYPLPLAAAVSVADAAGAPARSRAGRPPMLLCERTALVVEAVARARPGFAERADVGLLEGTERLHAADAVVVAAGGEAAERVVAAAMAAGCPPIVPDAGAMAEIVRHGETGWLVEPGDAVGLANALVEAVNRPLERRRRGERAAEAARHRFAWPALAQRLATVYDALRGVDRGLLAEA